LGYIWRTAPDLESSLENGPVSQKVIVVVLIGTGSRQLCRGIEVEAEARQGSNILNRGEARQRQRARGRGEAD